MTSTLRHDELDVGHESCTRDLSTYRTRPPVLRRSDASGEFPFYQPDTIGDVDELARLALGATLVLPINAEPAPPRHAVPTVYMPALPDTVWAEAARMRAAEAETQPVIDLAAVMPAPVVEDHTPLWAQGRHRRLSHVAPWVWMALGAGVAAPILVTAWVLLLAVTR